MFTPRTLTETDRVRGVRSWRALVVVGIVAAALFLILSANITLGQENLAAGQIAERDIRAPRDETFDSASETEALREEAAAAVLPVPELIESPADNQEDQLRAFDILARRVSRILEQRDAGTLDAAGVIARLSSEVPEIRMAHRQLTGELALPRWDLVAAAARGAVETTLAQEVAQDELQAVRTSVHGLITVDLAEPERELAGDLAAELIEPNVGIDEAATEQARDQARAEIPPVEVRIRAGETIVEEGQVLTVGDIEKLVELGLTRPAVQAGTVAGNALIAILVATLLVGYLWRFEPQIWHRTRSVLLFFLALLVSAIALRISADRTLWAFAVPTAATVLLIGILLHNSAGVAMAGGLAVLAGVMNREALEPAVYVLAGGVVSLLTITLAERLNAFVRVFAALFAVNVGVLTAFSLLGQRDLPAMLQLGAMGFVNAALSVILAVGSFAMLGNVFGIMTVFQLLELANPSNRLLRRLLLETPGTYHHSVMVGNLAERAAETIGADALLARVAAYYHDIGKMKNPLAFIENQAGTHNIHDDLNAETSARIIAGHIRDGIDLGYEHGLPVQVIGYIPQHHGTSVMTYFHNKALREVGGREDLVNEAVYRYPGPKPQSREAAIIMLADGVEASVRSLDEKDEASIRAMVDRIVDARLEDGQLDDAELTLKNIAQIKDAFVGQLLGMYHSRIKYPDNVVPMENLREQA
jgi:putative nucleotidyltransferase with HDIG domain